MVGLLDLHACSQSDAMSMERTGVFGELCLSCFLESGEEESHCGWCMVLSFTPLSLSQRVVCLLFELAPLSRNLSFIAFFSFDQINWVFSVFLPQRSQIGWKITFNYFFFLWISLTFRYAVILCAEAPFSILKKVLAPITSGDRRSPFSHFEESLGTDNIWWPQKPLFPFWRKSWHR